LGIEYPLYSKRLKTAGRTDLIAEWDGSLAIIDFKTSRKPKKQEWVKNYFLQATCYSLMLQERTGIVCPDIVILISVDDHEPQVFHKKRKDYLEEVVRIFTNYSA
jgi:genome maintenance exonuclease 1